MTKVVINTQHGGFGLSLAAHRRYLELKGTPAYLFYHPRRQPHYEQIAWDDPRAIKGDIFCLIATVPAPRPLTNKSWYGMTDDERRADNDWYRATFPNDAQIPRDDPALLQVLAEMGEEANGDYADLKVVEIPDDVDWQIEEYDGKEWIAERHRTWA